MLKSLVNLLQCGLNVSLTIVYIIIFILSILGVVDTKYSFLLEIDVKVINLSITTMTLFGIWIMFYMVYYICKIIECGKEKRR